MVDNENKQQSLLYNTIIYTIREVTLAIIVINNNNIFIYLPPLGRGDLHPKQVAVITANFINPPIVGVAILTVRV